MIVYQLKYKPSLRVDRINQKHGPSIKIFGEKALIWDDWASDQSIQYLIILADIKLIQVFTFIKRQSGCISMLPGAGI